MSSKPYRPTLSPKSRHAKKKQILTGGGERNVRVDSRAAFPIRKLTFIFSRMPTGMSVREAALAKNCSKQSRNRGSSSGTPVWSTCSTNADEMRAGESRRREEAERRKEKKKKKKREASEAPHLDVFLARRRGE